MAAVKELKHNYDEFNRTYGYRRIRPAYLYGFAGLLSLVWAGLIIYYARNSIYTSASLLKMLPHEFGGFLAGTIMPVGFIWMIAMYVDRNMNSNYEREVIYPFIQSIVDPHGDQGAIIAVIKQKISVESEALASLVSSMSSLYSQMEKTTREGKDSMEAAIAAATGYEGKLGLLTSELARASADLEGKATAMLDNLSENAARLASNSAITEEKAAAAAKGILAQTSALEYSLGQTLETTGRILDGVSAKKGELDATVEAALARTAEARDNLSQAGTVVQAAAGALETRAEQILAKVEDKTGQFIIKANISAEKISGVVANMENSASSLASISDETRKASSAALDKISEYSGFVVERLGAQSKLFTEKADGILSTVANIEARFGGLGKSMGTASDDIIKSFRLIAAEIAVQKESLFVTSGEAAGAISAIGEKVSGASTMLANATGEIQGASQSASDMLREQSAQFSAKAEEIRGAISSIDEAMQSSRGTLSEQAQSALEFAVKIRDTLKQQVDDLTNCANSVATNTRLSEAAIESQGKKMADAVEQLIIKASAIDSKIASAGGNIMNFASRIDEKLGAMSESVVAKATAAGRTISDAVERSESGAAKFRELSGEFAALARQASTELGSLVEGLRAQVAGIETSAKGAREVVSSVSLDIRQAGEVADGLGAIAEQFSKFITARTSEFELISNSSAKAVTNVASYVNKLSIDAQNTLDTFGAQYREIGALSEETTRRLSALVDELNSNKGVLRNALFPNAEDEKSFLNRAGFAVEKLNSIAIDLTKILSPEVARELWGKYNAGHKGVFSRYIGEELSKGQIGAVRQLVSNPEFATAARSFALEFDRLLLAARASDKGEALIVALTSSDIGKAYVVLKEVL